MQALLLALSLASSAQQPVHAPDTFTLAEVGEVSSLDPVSPYDNSSQSAILNMYDTLIGYDGESMTRFIPLIATQVPSRENGGISEDGRTYRFNIRKGVKFHEGGEVTPEDARYSLLRFMITDRAGGPSALLLEPIAGVPSTRDSSGTMTLDFPQLESAVRVEGDDVVVRLPRPFAPFLSIMARWSYVMSKGWARAHGEWDGTAATWKQFNNPENGRSYFHAHVDGTGPFRLERWDPVAKYVLMQRNDDYWRPKARLRRVLTRTVPEFSTRRLMLQAGDADLIETPRPLVAQLQDLQGVKIMDDLPRLVTDPVLFFTFKINALANRDIGSGQLDGQGIPSDFFSDPDVRRGFAYAFDYDALLKDTFKGAAQRAKGPVPPALPGSDPSQPFYRYDPKKAAAHMKKAWNGKVWERGFRFTLTYNVGAENREAACQILKKGLESLNPRFKVDLRGLDWAAYLDKAQQRLMPMFSRGWYADYPDAHNFVYAFYHSAGRYPSTQGYSSAGMDALIEKAVRQVDGTSRAELYRRIYRLGFQDVPAIFTVHPRGVYAARDWVRDLHENPMYLGIYFYTIAKR